MQAGWGDALLLESTGCVPRTPCIASWSDDQVAIRLPPGQGGGLQVSLYVERLAEWGPTGEFIRAPVGEFGYFAPGLSVVEPTPFDGTGADLVIMGANLGYDALLFDPSSLPAPADLSRFVEGSDEQLLRLSPVDYWAQDLEASRGEGDDAAESSSRRALQSADDEPLAARPHPVLLDLLLSGQRCTEIEWVRDEQTGERGGQAFLRCAVPRIPVGSQNVTIVVAGQSRFFDAELSNLFYSLCPVNYYGQEGELCLSCPQGAECPGELEEPFSLPGFWRLELEPTDRYYGVCPEERQGRPTCPFFASC